jgi:hypothetical protein
MYILVHVMHNHETSRARDLLDSVEFSSPGFVLGQGPVETLRVLREAGLLAENVTNPTDAPTYVDPGGTYIGTHGAPTIPHRRAMLTELGIVLVERVGREWYKVHGERAALAHLWTIPWVSAVLQANDRGALRRFPRRVRVGT